MKEPGRVSPSRILERGERVTVKEPELLYMTIQRGRLKEVINGIPQQEDFRDLTESTEDALRLLRSEVLTVEKLRTVQASCGCHNFAIIGFTDGLFYREAYHNTRGRLGIKSAAGIQLWDLTSWDVCWFLRYRKNTGEPGAGNFRDIVRSVLFVSTEGQPNYNNIFRLEAGTLPDPPEDMQMCV